jgi:hypothetical protein
MVTHIRLPDPKEIDSIIDGVGKRSEMSERKLKTAVNNALLSMSADQRAELLRRQAMSDANVQDLLKRATLDARGIDVLKKLIGAMQALDTRGLTTYPALGPDTRPLTGEEEKSVVALMAAVAAKMRDVAAGKHDSIVKGVFGDGHETDAKGVFSGAADALDRLRPSWLSSGGVCVDVMRKGEVWCCGALTNSQRMSLSDSAVAGATDLDPASEAFLTMVHESTHASSTNATTDILYDGHDGFLTASAQVKLKTADYYREVVRQVATGNTRIFTPGDVSLHLGETRSHELRQAATQADKVLNGAWISALRIHDVIHLMARDPGRFVGAEKWLRNASRLMGITVHRESELKFERNVLWPNTGPRITSADLSVMDNKVALLAQCNGKAGGVLVEPPVDASPPERVAHVLGQVLLTYRGALKFSKSHDKDIVVLLSLAQLHESVNAGGKNLLLDPGDPDKLGLAELPEPMKTYVAMKG